MPIHDWSRVSAGTFHDLHVAWIAEVRTALNSGVLPASYYAMCEQIAGPVAPDVLTLQAENGNGADVRLTAETDMSRYAAKQRTVAIRHSSDDRVVALIEIVSHGNKASQHGIRSFVEKAARALFGGLHLLILDLHPPGPRDPQGVHGAIWAEIEDDRYKAPPDKPLTLVAYAAGEPIRAFIEPAAVGDTLIDMPLFLEPEAYVNVPLEATYQEAYRGVPLRWRRVLEA